jgi:hypothetical protein
MPLRMIDELGVRFVEGMRGESLMLRAQDATIVIEACFSGRALKALFYPENLTAQFFDLSSGEAGDVLEKLRRCQIRLAIVCAPGVTKFSSRFRGILADGLRVFDTRDEARQWLGR